ncbi:hypothetical protein T4B_10852, partial [Trichinella pseudospiralis]
LCECLLLTRTIIFYSDSFLAATSQICVIRISRIALNSFRCYIHLKATLKHIDIFISFFFHFFEYFIVILIRAMF